MKSRRRWHIAIGAVLVLVLAIDAFLLIRKQRYDAEAERLRSGMTEVERLRTDALVARDKDRAAVMFQLIRRQALGDPNLHLSVMLDSSLMILERSNAILREMPVEIGGESSIDTTPASRRIAIPSGVRSIDRLIGRNDRYTLPAWVWEQRNLPVPEDRSHPKYLGAGGMVLSGGTLVYAMPQEGPLADTSWVMPGTIRIRAADLDAIRPNLVRGMKIYLF
jgi:hypothetical protein